MKTEQIKHTKEDIQRFLFSVMVRDLEITREPIYGTCPLRHLTLWDMATEDMSEKEIREEIVFELKTDGEERIYISELIRDSKRPVSSNNTPSKVNNI